MLKNAVLLSILSSENAKMLACLRSMSDDKIMIITIDFICRKRQNKVSKIEKRGCYLFNGLGAIAMDYIKSHKILSGAVIFMVLLSALYYFRLTPLSSDSNPANVITKYYENLSYLKYSDSYELLSASSQKKITKENYMERYKNVYDAIELKGITYLDIVKTGETDTTAVYTMKYKYATGKAGDIENEIKITLVKEGSVWRITYAPNLIFSGMEDNDTVSVYSTQGVRGDIITQDKTVLATNVKGYSLYVNPKEITNKEAAAAAIAKVTNTNESNLLKKLQSDTSYIEIKLLTPQQAVTAEAINAAKITGVYIKQVDTLIRNYPQGELMAHVIGYVGSLSTEEYESLKDKGYSQTDVIGKSGLEKEYEDTLKGSQGFVVAIYGDNGKVKKIVYKHEAQPGKDVWLTINGNLQKRAHDILKTKLGGTNIKGSVIVINPKTGEVLAIESYPTFDANVFLGSISDAQWKALTANNSLFSIATQALYPPGSTVKPFIADAALKAGTITVNSVFNGKIVSNKWTPDRSDWVYPAITRVKTPATVNNLTNALIYSDNIYFAWVAMNLDLQKLLSEYETMGFSKAFDFDVPVATSRLKNDETVINIKIQADMGYGQGELLVTPIQLSSMFGAFANNGTIMKPYMLKAVKQKDGITYNTVSTTEPSILQENVIAQDSLAVLRPILKQVITQGTGVGANISSISILGKTGTAQISKTREIGWFAAYYESGDRLVLVTLDGTPDEVKVKGSIAREMLQP